MKKDIHPKYFKEAKVTCACGNTFTVGSTIEDIHVEICSACHPFYTGKQKLVDTARRVDKFQKKVDRIIAEIQDASKDRKPAAVHAMVEMILGRNLQLIFND